MRVRATVLFRSSRRHNLPDPEGVDLAGPSAARERARVAAREMAAVEVLTGYLDLSHRIDVRTEDGEVITAVYFRDAIELCK